MPPPLPTQVPERGSCGYTQEAAGSPVLGCSPLSGGAGGAGGFPCREREGQGCPSPSRSCDEPVRAQPTAPRGELWGEPPHTFPGEPRGSAGAHPGKGGGDPRVRPPGRAGSVPVAVRWQRHHGVALLVRGTGHRVAPGAQPVPVLSPARGTERERGDLPAAHLCRPPAARGLRAAVVHRPRPQGLAGVEVHGIRLLPLDVLESHRSLRRGQGMSP